MLHTGTTLQPEVCAFAPAPIAVSRPLVVTSDWRARLPVLSAGDVTLRELRATDAPSLLAQLSTEEVSRFLSPPPTTVEQFERFIAWTHLQRQTGRFVCFGIVPAGMDVAVGIIQVHSLGSSWETAEWGFALGASFWGSGLFADGAVLVVRFAFEHLGVHRLEARAVVQNGRGNGALRKVGATPEAILRQSFRRHDQRFDQGLWTILRDEWVDPGVPAEEGIAPGMVH